MVLADYTASDFAWIALAAFLCLVGVGLLYALFRLGEMLGQTTKTIEHTEAELQVARCETDLAWIEREPSLFGDQRLAQWDVALRRLAVDCDRHDRELVEATHARVRAFLDDRSSG